MIRITRDAVGGDSFHRRSCVGNELCVAFDRQRGKRGCSKPRYCIASAHPQATRILTNTQMRRHRSFAVLDVETTGFGNADRVVDFAIVGLGQAGNTREEWDTLIDPSRTHHTR